jgi:hypothetical protein
VGEPSFELTAGAVVIEGPGVSTGSAACGRVVGGGLGASAAVVAVVGGGRARCSAGLAKSTTASAWRTRRR